MSGVTKFVEPEAVREADGRASASSFSADGGVPEGNLSLTEEDQSVGLLLGVPGAALRHLLGEGTARAGGEITASHDIGTGRHGRGGGRTPREGAVEHL
ncbi:hypothetical protein GCM10017771_97340 [Streptomyces capitiformicae]|uniref:Uncharacterized protein n=1 Tax=Streptomyces capitiformicae TaxID=2014920 RepID=A0A919DT26_9ACTN|nr:hypothetical protein GCM10017771_97340 [Streptomyces capitiformicae]